jgi:hypothetical protein
MRLFSRITNKTIAFAVKREGSWRYRVEIHGMTDLVGLTRDAMEQELNDGAFFDRVEGPEAETMRAMDFGSGKPGDRLALTFTVKGENGKHPAIHLECHCLEETAFANLFILVFEPVG